MDNSNHTINVIVALLTVLVFVAGCGAAPSRGQMPAEGAMPAPNLGITTDGQLVVVAVEPGSAAQQAGITRGDVLVSLDNHPITAASYMDIRRRIAGVPAGQTLPMVVQRAGQVVSLRVTFAPPPPRPNQPTATAVPPSQFYF
jgi:S1-C subfamily serine protease